MVDEIRADLEVNFSGNVNKDLPKVIGALERFESLALSSAGAFEKLNHVTRSTELRKAAADAAVYRKELERLVKVQAATTAANPKVAGGTITRGRGDETAEASLKRAQREQEKYINSLSNTRYALYDVQRTATVAAVALTAVFAVPLVKFTQTEQQFASVARTVGVAGQAANDLRSDFLDLTTEIPKAFSELAEIGTLAGQLDIPAESVEKFTEVVSKFAATTNVTAATAAEQIGRTAQLTQTAASEYENLASSIYQVGVTSVATEGQILEMMSQISTAGNLAGLANTDIVALAGALASLGIQPEAARGSLQRLFNLIENGATTATAYTGRLAEITSMTADEMNALWKDGMGGSQAVFSAFIDGLGRMQDAGQNTTNVLREMGVYQVRDQRLLQVLANNTEVYAKALKESGSAYASGTALAEGYAKQTDTLASNFQLLLNTLGAIAVELGEIPGGVLNEVVTGFLDLSKSLLVIVRNPVAQTLGAIVISLALVAAGIAGYIALASRMQAAVFGMITAHDGLNRVNVNTTFNLHSLTKQLIIQALAFRQGSVSGQQFAGTLNQVGASAASSAAGMNGAAAASGRMVIASRGVAAGAKLAGTALLALGKAGAVMIALTAVIWGISEAMRYFRSEAEKSEEFWGGTDTSGLAAAIKQDSEEAKKAGVVYREITIEQGKADDAGRVWSTTLQDLATTQANAKAKIDETTGAIERQTIALGDNVVRQMAQEFASQDDIVAEWQKSGAAIEAAGFDLQKFYRLVAEGGDQATTYLHDFFVEFQRLQAESGGTMEDPGVYKLLDILSTAATTYETKIQNATTSSELFGKVMGEVADSASEAGDEIEIAGQKFANLKAYVDSVSESVRGPYELEKAFRDLGTTLAEGAQSFSKFGDAGKDSVDAVLKVVSELQQSAGSDEMAFGKGILELMASLQAEGINTGNNLSFLGEMLNQTLGGTYNLNFNSSAAQSSIVDVIDKAIAAQSALVQLQATALGQLQSSTLEGATPQMLAQLAASQGQYASSLARLKGLENLRAAALMASGKAHGELEKKVKSGTKANNSNSASTKRAARSILDWVGELRQVMNTADELRFGVQDAWAKIVEAQKDAAKSLVETVYDIGAALDKATLSGQHSDNLWSLFYDVQDASEDAAKKVIDATNDIQDAIAELQNIGSQRSQLEYGLNVANLYGDLLRAEEIRAKLAELDAKEAKTQADLVDSQNDLADAIDAQNKSLIGNSKQAIKNRSTVKNLAEEYIDWINKVAEGGATSEELSAAVAQAKQDFIDQAVAMGFSESQLQSYISAFSRGTTSVGEGADAVRDLYEAWQEYILQLVQSGASQSKINAAIAQGKKEVADLGRQMGLAPQQVRDYINAFNGMDRIIDKIPKNITTKINADSDPADKAIKDFLAKNSNGRGASAGIRVPIAAAYDGGKSGTLKNAEEKMAYYAEKIMHTTNMAALTEYSKQWTKYKKIAMASLWTGGYTGKGGKYEPRGIVHAGEYVVPKQEVNQSTKLPYFMERTAPSVVNNTQSWPSVIMVELSPTDRALLAETGGSVVMIDGKAIATAVNGVNRASNVRGNA